MEGGWYFFLWKKWLLLAFSIFWLEEIKETLENCTS
jgi:hypothetical protein